jgi:hypothetical protein
MFRITLIPSPRFTSSESGSYETNYGFINLEENVLALFASLIVPATAISPPVLVLTSFV